MKGPDLPIYYDTENINNLLADWHLWVYYNDTISKVKYKGGVRQPENHVISKESTYFT